MSSTFELRAAPEMSGQSSVDTSFPLGAILALAIGGPALFALLTIPVILYLRKKDRLKRKKAKEGEDAKAGNEDGVRPRTSRTSLRLSQIPSFIPFLPPEQACAGISNEWLEDESMMDEPPMTKAQARRLSQKGMFPMPSFRDSWPLAGSMSNVPLRLLHPSPSMVTLNQVGGGGYVVPPEQPKWPGRTYSRKSTKIVVPAQASNMQRFSESALDVSPKRPTYQRRSASVNQLSTILRSTSQRLKAAQRKSLSRTLTTFGGSTGPPPANKIMTPRKLASASIEVLIDPAIDPVIDPEGDDGDTVATSICDANFNPSPSPTQKDGTDSGHGSLGRRSSVTPSAESVDSLCVGATPDLVIPAALTSPSKRSTKRPQRHAIRISSSGAKDLSAMIRGEGRASTLELDTQGSSEEKAAFTSPHRISSSSDPFYSVTQSGKRAVPQNMIIGPRPLYIRHTTFGHEATLERPASFMSTSSSPLRNISGNVQSSPSRASDSMSVASESKANPFSWDPEPLMTGRQQNPTRTGSRRKGHKRSKVVRISLLQQRTPYLSPLPAESEDVPSPLKFNVSLTAPTLTAPMRTSDPAKSPSPKPSSISSQRLSSRPPSIKFFNPVLSIPELAEQRDPVGDSPTLGFDSPHVYSPTLSVSNYYSEGHTSEDDFFNAKPVELSDASISKVPQHKHSTTAAFPRPEHKELFSFPPLSLNSTPNAHPSLPPSRPSTASSSLPTSPILLKPPQSLPTPPILTQSSSTPSRLNGPRSEPPKRVSTASLGPRDSLLHQSICMLRRMNSEISHCSVASSDEEEGRISPRLAPKLSPNPNWGRRFERQSQGSKAYLTMGMSDSQRRSRVGKHQSSRRSTFSEKHRVKEEDEDASKWTPTGLETMAESKAESPNRTPNEVKRGKGIEETLKFPSLTSQGETGTPNEYPPPKDSLTTELVTPTSPSQSPLKSVRWSDATPSPTIRVIRHESQLLQPSPQSPPAWGWSKTNIEKEGVKGIEDGKENLVHTTPVKKRNKNWNNNSARPDSLGLYDADGFLRSSPEKGRAADV